VFQAEAEIRWLDHCEASLARHTPELTLPRAVESDTDVEEVAQP
jgi:hypothetical protein